MAPPEQSTSKPAKKPFWKWRSVRIIGGLLVLWLVLVHLVIPLAAKIYLQKWLLDNGADSAVIGKVVINPLLGVAALEGVHVERDGQTVFSNAAIRFNLGLRYLFGKEAHIQRANLADIVIDLERYDDESIRVGSYRIPPTPPEETPEAIEKIEEDLPWIFYASEVSLTNVTIRYRQPDMLLEVVIEEALLEKFNTDPDNKEGALTLKALVNGAPVELELPTLNVTPTLEINGKVSISELLLDNFSPLLTPYLDPFKGKAGLNGDIDFAMRYDMAELNVHYNGNLGLANGDVAGQGWAAGSGLDWKGILTFTMQGEDIGVEVDGDLKTTNSTFNLASPIIEVENKDIDISGRTTVTIAKEMVIDTNASLALAPTHFAMDFVGADTGNLSWDGKVRVGTGDAEKPLTVLADGTLHVEKPAFDVSVGDGRLKTENGLLDWVGLLDINLGVDNQPMNIVVDGDLSIAEAAFGLETPLIDISSEKLGIAGKTVIEIGEEVVIDSDASVQLDQTDYSMEILKTAVADLGWKGKLRVATGTDESPFSVFAEGSVNTETPSYSMVMEGGDLQTGTKRISWNGTVEYSMGPGSAGGSSVHTDGELAADELQFQLPGTAELTQGSLEMQGTSMVTMGEKLAVEFDGGLTLGDTKLELPDIELGKQKLEWLGTAQYGLTETGQELGLDGNLTVEEIFVDLGGPVLEVEQERLLLAPSFSLQLAETPSFAGELSLEGAGLAIRQDGLQLLSLEDIAMSKAQENGSGGFSIKSLRFNELKLPASAQIPVNVTIPSIALSGIDTPDLTSFSLDSVTIEQPRVTDGDQQMVLASLATIGAEKIRVDKELSLTVAKIKGGKSEFLKPEKGSPQLTLGGLVASDISYSPEHGLIGDAIVFDSVNGAFTREKPDETSEKAETVDTGTEGDVNSQEESGEAAGIPVKISQVDVTGTSGFKFTDLTLTRTFVTQFTLDSLAIKDIDLNQPEKPFEYELQGSFDKYSPLTIKGSSAPLGQDLMLEQVTTLRNYSMPHSSPYVIEAIGTWFPEGRLDLYSTLSIGGGYIDMDNNLLFKELQAQTVDDELAAQLNNQLPVSLDMAISMLSDRDGTIDIDVPISGPLDSFGIGLAELLITTLGKSITLAVTPYLAYTALGPTGALAYVGVRLGQSMLETSLPVIEFEPGSVEISEDHKVILDKIGPDLENDKEQSYSICAKVSAAEITSDTGNAEQNQQALQNEKIRQELFKIGESRSLAVRDYLTEKYEIDADRLLICNPGLILDESEKPRVEFRQ